MPVNLTTLLCLAALPAPGGAPHRFAPSGDGFSARAGQARVEVDRGGRVLVRSGAGPALELATRGQPAAPALQADGSLRIARGRLAEELLVREEGLEQRWRVPRRPRGGGGLRIEVRASGLPLRRLDARGALFGAGRAAIRYGAATWIDARGRRTAIPLRAGGGGLVLEVPADLVARSEFPATLDPLIGPELPLGAPVLVPAAGIQAEAAAAFDGTRFLVVWADDRTGAPHVRGARVTPAGEVLDPFGFPIAVALPACRAPAIDFDGTHYLVVWQQAGGNGESNIHGARVRPDTAVLDPGGFPITTAAGNQVTPSVAFDGTRHLVAWRDTRVAADAGDLFGVRLSTTGDRLDPVDLPLSLLPEDESKVRVLGLAGQFFLAWEWASGAAREVRLATVSAAGAVAPSWTLAAGAQSPAGAVDPASQTALIAWVDVPGTGPTQDLHAVLLGQDAGALMLPLGVSVAAGWRDLPSAAFNGADFVVGWVDGRSGGGSELYAARVRPDGTVADPSGLQVAAGRLIYEPVLAAGARTLAVWRDAAPRGETDLFGALVEPDGGLALASPQSITSTFNNQLRPSIARGDGQHLVVWSDNRGGSYDIYGARLGDAGELLDPAGFPINQEGGDQLDPDVSYGGGQYLVAWQHQEAGDAGIGSARVLPDGGVLDLPALEVSPGPPAPDGIPISASSGPAHLVVWVSNSGTDLDVLARRVDLNGAFLDAPALVLGGGPGHQTNPVAASDGTDFLVLWEDWSSGITVRGARVAAQGLANVRPVLLDPAFDGGQRLHPAVTFTGSGYAAAWVDSRGPGTAVYLARLDRSGAVLDPGGVRLSPPGAPLPRYPWLAADPAGDLLAVWHAAGTAPQFNLVGARVDRNGALIDLAPLPLGSGLTGQDYAVVQGAGPARYLVAYPRPEPRPEVASTRSYVREVTIAPGAAGSPCSLPSDCQSAQCVGNVCCATACSTGYCRSGACTLPDGGPILPPANLGVGCGCTAPGAGGLALLASLLSLLGRRPRRRSA